MYLFTFFIHTHNIEIDAIKMKKNICIYILSIFRRSMYAYIF